MEFKQTKPCKKCPFRTDAPGYLKRARAERIAADLDENSFVCHETIDYNAGDIEPCETDRTQHCAGALIMREHMGRPSQMMRIGERLGLYDHRRIDMDAPVHRCDQNFIAAHDA